MKFSKENWSDIVRALILTGQEPSRLDNFNQLITDKFYSWPRWEIWDTLTEDLSMIEHEFLGKGFVYWSLKNPLDGGSVTPLIGIYKAYEKKYPQTANDFASWIIKHSNNQWAPYGTSRDMGRRKWNFL